jgi:hypothetical protein
MYGIVRTDRMSGTKQPADLISAKYLPDGTATAIENGRVVLIGALVTGEREVYTATAPLANSALDSVALVASPELLFDERKHKLDEFRNEVGEIVRCYRFRSGNIFSVTTEAIDNNTGGAIAVGSIIELQADTKFSAVAILTGESTQVGTVIAIDVVNSKTFYVIQVA